MEERWFSQSVFKPASPPAATEIRRRFGLEAGQVTLGHATADVSQIHAERDLSLAAHISGRSDSNSTNTTAKMAMDLQDWLWKLDCVQKEMQRRAPHVHVVFSLRVHLAEGARTKCNTFPLEHGKVVERSEDPVAKFQDLDAGLLWFDLGHERFHFVTCWEDFVEGPPPSASIPKEELPHFADETLGWNTWYYLEASGEESPVEMECQHPRREVAGLWQVVDPEVLREFGPLTGAASEVCHSAPRSVLDKVGDLSLLGWPTALLYLATRRVHPLLRALGYVTIDDSVEDDGMDDFESFEIAKDLVIELRPSDLATATAYAFDVLRHIAKRGELPTEPEDRVPARTPDSKTERSKPFVPTPLQNAILKALDGRALKKQALADKVCASEGSRLYKPGGIKELMAIGKVHHKHGVGYYRPDAPPPGTIELNQHGTN